MRSPCNRFEPQPDRSLKGNLTDWAKKYPEFALPSTEADEPKTKTFFDIVDATEKIQCQIQVTKSKKRESIPGEQFLRGQRLVSCLLIGQKDGKRVEVDLCEVIEKAVPGLRIFVSDMADPYHRRSANIIVLRGLSSAFSIFTLLHEFGHARQHRDEKYRALSTHYSDFSIPQILLSRGEHFPDPKRLRSDIMEISKETNIEGLIERSEPFLVKLDLLFRRFAQSPYPSELIKKQYFAEGEVLLQGLRQVLEIPKKILERDADARMLADLRALASRGIDLLFPFIAEGEDAKSVTAHDTCGAAVQKTIKDVYQRTNEYRSTHGASTPQILNTYGKIPRLKSDPRAKST